MGTGGGNTPIVTYDMKQHHNPQESDTVQLTTENCAAIRGDSPIVVHGTQDPIISDKAHTLGCNQGQENVLMAVHQNASGELRQSGVCYTLSTNSNASGRNTPLVMQYQGQENVIAIHDKATRYKGGGDTRNNDGSGNGFGMTEGGPMYTLTVGDKHSVYAGTTVRRVTPVEAERLQGFPDNHTDITWKNKPAPDGQRYKAMGNSMAVPVMRWIGERIQKHEDEVK